MISGVWNINQKGFIKKLKSPLDIGIYECYILYKFDRLNR